MAKKSICPVCSLPIELCVCQSVSKEESRIKVRTDKRKWGRVITLIEFLGSTSDINLGKIAKKLKSKAACGGTVDGNIIELQGDHRFQIRKYLKELGFDEANIQIS